MALIAAAIGLIFFLVAIFFLLINQAQNISLISVISGALIEVISGLNFYLYGQASKQLAYYHGYIDKTQRFLLANSVCETLDVNTRQDARSKIVAAMTVADR